MKWLSLLFLIHIALGAQSPQIGNYFLDYNITPSDIDSLALCDFIVLDMEVGNSTPHVIDSLRSKNPNITIIAYIASQEYLPEAVNWNNSLRQKYIEGIKPEWNLLSSKKEPVVFWPKTEMTNMTNLCPQIGGERQNSYIARFINENILSSGKWDG